MSNPANMMKYQNNPKVMKVFAKLTSKVGGGGGFPGNTIEFLLPMSTIVSASEFDYVGMGGGFPGMGGGFPGMGGGFPGFGGGEAPPPSQGPPKPSATDDLD